MSMKNKVLILHFVYFQFYHFSLIFLEDVSIAILITAFLLILTLPLLSSGLVLLLLDLHFNTIFYEAAFGGDPVLFQHLFWFFGHPEVYILIIPSFSCITQLYCSLTSSLLFCDRSLAVSILSIAVLGSVVWSHHLYTVGLDTDTKLYFSSTTFLIAIPTSMKIIHYLLTVWGSNIGLSAASAILGLAFISLFTIGGSTGIILGNAIVDISLHDTYYVVGHFHFILSLSGILAVLAASIHYSGYIMGMSISYSTNTVLYTIVLLVGFTFTFIPLHCLGFNAMPRRIMDYSNLGSINYLATIGSTLTTISFILFII